jgi:phosphoribosylanthranilate isomerase
VSKIKICGITSVADALAAVDAGADFIGLIFVKASPRSVNPAVAGDIADALKGRAQTVAVFQNDAPDVVRSICEKVKPDLVQLHGSESPDYCLGLGRGNLIKAFQIDSTFEFSNISAYSKSVDYLLVDRPKTDKDDRWIQSAIDLVNANQQSGDRLFFAGGLNAGNVRHVVRMLQPFAVDVASGVESSPGVKDAQKMIAFCQAVRGVSINA